jgi:hypothetical protein
VSHVAIILCVCELTTPLGLPDLRAGAARPSMFSIKVLIVVRGDHQRVGISRIGHLPKTFAVRRYGTVHIRQWSNGPTHLLSSGNNTLCIPHCSYRTQTYAFVIRSLSKPNHLHLIRLALRELGPSIFVPEEQPTTRKRSFWIAVFRLTPRVRPHEEYR